MIKSLKTILVALLFSLVIWPGKGQVRKNIPPAKPKLVLGIVIDPLSIDQLNRYWDILGEDGFKRFVSEGTFYRNASYASFFTETVTGLATLSTGAYPVTHGIVGNSWYEPLSDRKVYCTRDDRVHAVGGTFENGLHSPVNLLASTFGDELRLATRNRSKVFGISLYAENAVLIAGHMANAAWWYDDNTGSWMSSSYYMDSLPAWVNGFNDKNLVSVYLRKIWEPLFPLEKYVASNGDTSQFETGIKNRSVFPYDLKKLSSLGKKKEDLSLIRYTPFGNTLTKDFAINLILNENLGKDDDCDFLGVVFSANQTIDHAFGTYSVEMEDAVLRLDQDLAHLLNFINQEIGKENVIIYLTASRGVPPATASLTNREMPAGRFRPNQSVALLRSYLNAVLGEGDWVKGYYNHQVYLNRTLIENAGLSLNAIQDRVAGFMVQFSGVGHVIAAHELSASGAANDLFKRLQMSFYPKRSGDVVIVLNPGWVEQVGDEPATGAGFWYDTHVPLFLYGWKIGRNSWYRAVDLSDISPTLSFFLHIPVPNGSDGNLFLELLDKNESW
ncbi:MAG: alkaline phosphatase family protein [Chlorobi bacterium]|nr:alkaline phosphatase family protein [Chlorobiota bacterium]